ncbi:MAG: HD domain-containing protein [Phycisphaerae bacterium]|jgi:3'-5' exoribonuclease
MAHLFIDQVQAGQQINDVYLISQAVLRSTTNGKLYIAMFVADKTGKTNGRVWNATEELFKSLPKEGFVQIIGRSELYQNTLQIVADKIAAVPSDKINIDDYLPRTPKNIKQMYEEMLKILGEIKNPSVKALVDEFIKDKELMKKFCKAPAAMSNHHSYLGGLLEHTHNMLNSAKAILPCYPHLQADLVLAGIFLHDMGKTEELSYEMAFGYTDRGQLIGHIVQTALMVDQKADAIEISQTILDSITHIILSHHGEYEFGSPKLPMTAEAYLVNFLDNIDAKMNQIMEKIETDPSQDNWTGFIKSLDSKLYRKRVVD